MISQYAVPVITITSDGARLIGTTSGIEHYAGVAWNFDALHFGNIDSREGFEGGFYDAKTVVTPAQQSGFVWEYEGVTFFVETTDKGPELIFAMGALTGDTTFIQATGAPGTEQDAYP